MSKSSERTLKGATVLVTGGAGFIGSHLVEALVAEEAKVTVLDNFSTGRPENLTAVQEDIEVVKVDLRTVDWRKLLDERTFGFIFHFAANAYVPPSVENPREDFEINAVGTLRLLEGMRQAKSPAMFIYASSAGVYGNPQKLPISEDDPAVPISPYGVSKLTAERYVAVYSELYNLPAASLRIFSCYGPRQRKQVVYDFICKLHRNPLEMEIWGDGRQKRDLIYVEDVVSAALVVAQRAPLRGEVYNVATGRSVTTRELAEKLAKLLGAFPQLRFVGHVRPGDAQRWEASTERLRGLGWEPKWLLEEGLRETIGSHRDLRHTEEF